CMFPFSLWSAATRICLAERGVCDRQPLPCSNKMENNLLLPTLPAPARRRTAGTGTEPAAAAETAHQHRSASRGVFQLFALFRFEGGCDCGERLGSQSCKVHLDLGHRLSLFAYSL